MTTEETLVRLALASQELQIERATRLNLTLYRLVDGKIEPVSAREFFDASQTRD